MDISYCEALKFALNFELKGEKFYRDSLDKVDDPHALKTLQFLAKEESSHIDKIERFNQSLLEEKEFNLSAECSTDLNQNVKGFLQEFIGKKEKEIREKASDIEIYDLALEMENSGYNMYKKAFEESEEESLRKFFNFLMDEESLHYNLISASKKYLEDPSYYFEDYGSWIFGQ